MEHVGISLIDEGQLFQNVDNILFPLVTIYSCHKYESVEFMENLGWNFLLQYTIEQKSKQQKPQNNYVI